MDLYHAALPSDLVKLLSQYTGPEISHSIMDYSGELYDCNKPWIQYPGVYRAKFKVKYPDSKFSVKILYKYVDHPTDLVKFLEGKIPWLTFNDCGITVGKCWNVNGHKFSGVIADKFKEMLQEMETLGKGKHVTKNWR